MEAVGKEGRNLLMKRKKKAEEKKFCFCFRYISHIYCRLKPGQRYSEIGRESTSHNNSTIPFKIKMNSIF